MAEILIELAFFYGCVVLTILVLWLTLAFVNDAVKEFTKYPDIGSWWESRKHK